VADPLSRNPSFETLNALRAITTRKQARTDSQPRFVESESQTDTHTEPAAKRRRTTPASGANLTETAVTVAPNDLVGKLIAAYKTDPCFRSKSNTNRLRYLERLWWQQHHIVVPNNDSV